MHIKINDKSVNIFHMCYWRERVLARESQSQWRKRRLGLDHITHLQSSPSVNKKRQYRQRECNVYATLKKVDRTQITQILADI